MTLHEECTQSFVIKLWLEEHEDERGQPLWRGHITRVTDGKRHYFTKLSDIPDIIAPSLDLTNSHGGVRERIRQWLKREHE